MLKLCPEAAQAASVVGAELPKVGEHGVHEGDVAGGARGVAQSLWGYQLLSWCYRVTRQVLL